MHDPAFKTQLFRFVDVMPVLRTPDAIHQHLVEYLTQEGVNPPPFLKSVLRNLRKLLSPSTMRTMELDLFRREGFRRGDFTDASPPKF